MYYVIMENHDYSYEIFEILSLYFPGEKISVCESEDNIPANCTLIRSTVNMEGNRINSSSSLYNVANGIMEEVKSEYVSIPMGSNIKKSIKHGVKLSTFILFKEITNIEVPWGILVGIRPTKIVNELRLKNVNDEDIYGELKHKYLLTDSKAKLVMEVSENNYGLINRDKGRVSIYIGIPFCPTRCVYCSFASYPIYNYSSYVKAYMDALRYEIQSISNYIRDNFSVDTIYVGGGTPTSLDDESFSMLLEIVSQNFDIDSLNEFTVEAGRPDTINSRNLKSMKQYHVSRISINPQSMNAETLKKIGRDHTVEDIVEKYNLARDLGFNNINMDMIIGLPDEGISHIERTLSQIIHLSPENITVHTMAVKRASKLKEKLMDQEPIRISDGNGVSNMMNLVYKTLHQQNYIPYYMYRQKMMIGNLENVGYCKPDFECLYNIQMIEERETIIGIGADAVTKLVFHDENRIERTANKKDIKEYINTIHEAADKKLRILSMLT